MLKKWFCYFLLSKKKKMLNMMLFWYQNHIFSFSVAKYFFTEGEWFSFGRLLGAPVVKQLYNLTILPWKVDPFF